MAKRALIEHRPWLMASVIGAIAYYFASDDGLPGVWLMLLKGTGVGLLMVYALRRVSGLDGSILAIMMGLSACADMVLQISFVGGGAVFFLSHLAAIALYLRNPRESTTSSQRMFALVLLIGTPIISYLLSGQGQIALYSAGLGAMAAAAWMSAFPRYRVGVGAVLFVASDWLIFSRMGPMNLAPLPDLLVWPLYYAGQLMIATGVVQSLRGETPQR